MAPPLHDPKDLTGSLQLDYFKHPRPLNRWLRRLCWLALAATLAWVGWSLLFSRRTAYQAGPLSAAHTLFANDCARCHTEAFPALSRFVGDTAARSVPDSACLQCHPGPDHHPPQARSAGCAACHKEHRGHVTLARIPDGYCTDCHADLKRTKPGTRFENVAGFYAHPEFAFRRENKPDPGTIKFSHHHHLTLEPDPRRPDTAAAAEKLQRQQCAACHEPEPDGRYMKPVRYEQNCRECHPLQVSLGVKFKTPQLEEAERDFARTPVAHPKPGEGPETVRALLRERLVGFSQRFPAAVQPGALAGSGRPLPGSRRGRLATDAELNWASARLAEAERRLFDGAGGCGQCHQEKSDRKRTNGLPDYGRPSIPRRWFDHAVFNHERHRMLQCTECHRGATTSKTAKDVLMPAVADCRSCHHAGGGARSDCAECHAYHPRPQGDWKGNLRIADCAGQK
jgi:hypothetical protein